MNRLVFLPLLASASLAVHAQTYVDNAQVRSVWPQYESVSVPRQECTSQWINEPRRIEAPRGYGGAMLGGLAGGVIGNQVGNGHGREAATALGAVLGALTGDQMANRQRGDRYEQVQRQVQSCQNINEVQQRLTGYRVAYEYRGQQFSAVLPQDPGPTLQVRVSVEPVVR